MSTESDVSGVSMGSMASVQSHQTDSTMLPHDNNKVRKVSLDRTVVNIHVSVKPLGFILNGKALSIINE